ncbi:MAG TPA: hypothetical protein VGQ56_23500 [Gemmatimonadaceae bacterium]|jgi:hypothetical protein|nr:hypothetical protein [Gemmatimonadaceae bacterium]
MRRAFVGVVTIALLALPSMRGLLEGMMIAHMLVQIPLLAVAGGLAVTALSPRQKARLASWNEGGVAGILMAIIASSWWMVPRALDWALLSPRMETLKFVSLPLFVGAPAALSWPKLSGVARGFVIANVLPMWTVVGWLYMAAPVRVCNFYLTDQQVTAGVGLLGASSALAVVAGVATLLTHTRPREQRLSFR